MPTIGQVLGDNIYSIAYGPQYNAMKRKQALDDAGYVPSENDGLIDSFQSGLAGSMGGLFGELSGWAKNSGYDWIANEAMYGANQMGNIAARNAYTGNSDRDGFLYYGANQAASALGSSVPSLVTDVAVSAAADAAIGSVVPGAGTAAGATVGALAGVGRWANRLYEGSKAIQYGTKAAKVAGSIAVGGLVENLSNAGDTYMTGLSRGMNHDEAWSASNESFEEGWAPAVLNYAADKVSLGMPMKGISAAMAVGTGGKVLAKTAGAWAGNAMIGATGEGLTEAWQQQIQEQSLGNSEYDNVHIYDPSTWTDEMSSQAKDAFAGSLMLGGIGGAVNAGRGWMGNRSNTNVVVNDEVNTNIQPSTTVDEDVYENTPIEPANSIENTDLEYTNLGDIVPDQFVEPERGDYDDVFDTMNARFDKNNYTEEEKVVKQQAVQDTVQRITDLWDNSVDEVGSKKLVNNMYMEDFMDAGLTKPEANEASKTLVQALRKKSNVEEVSPISGKGIVERADKIGYQLTDTQRADLLSDNPIKQNLRDTDSAVTSAEVAIQRREIQERNRKAEADKRSAYSAHYEDSINKPFLDPVFGERAEETGYRISNAIAERESDRRNKPKVSQDYVYLRKHGINSNNYTDNEMKMITNHVKSIEKAKANSDKKGLKKRSADNANVVKANQVYTEAFKNLDKEDPRDTAKIKQVKELVADNMIQLGKQGKPIHRYDMYKEFKKHDKALYNRINQEVYGEEVSQSTQLATKPTPNLQIQANPKKKPSFKKGSVMAKVAENPELRDLIKAQFIDVNKAVKEEKAKLEKAVKEETKEPVKRGPYKTHAVQGESVLADLREGKVSPREAIEKLAHIEKNAKNKHKPALRKMIEMVKANTNDKNELKQYNRTPEGKEKEAQVIRDHINRLQEKINEGSVTNKGYDTEVRAIKKQIDKFNTNHLGDTKEYSFEMPKYEKDTRRTFVKAHDEGTVSHPAYVRTAVLEKPSSIDKQVFKWLSKELNKNIDKYDNGERAKIIKSVLVKEYNDVIESVGGPVEAWKSHPDKVKNLAYAIAGSFPKQRFANNGHTVQATRNKTMFNSGEGLTQTQFDEKDKLISFAKRYFKEGFEEKIEPKQVERVTKEDGRKNNGKQTESPIKITSVSTTEDPDIFHFEMVVNSKADLKATLENIGIDTDAISNQKINGNKVSFNAELFLSSTPFDGSMTSTLKDEANKSAIYDAREQILKAAISNSENGSLLMDRDSVAGLQKTLDKLYGKGEYKIDKLDGQVLIHPKDVSIEEAQKEAVEYQFGKEEKKPKRKILTKLLKKALETLRKIFGKLKADEFSEKELGVIIRSIHNTSPASEATFKFLDRIANVLTVKKVKGKRFNGITDFGTSSIMLAPSAIKANSSTMVHEVTHYALNVLGDTGTMSRSTHVTWQVLDNTLKDWRKYNERRRSESEVSVQTNQRGSSLDRRRPDNTRDDSGIQTTSQRSDDTPMQGRDAIGIGGRRTVSSESENGGNRYDSTRENVSRESGIQTSTPQSLSRLGNPSSWGIELGISSLLQADVRIELENLKGDTNQFLNQEMSHSEYLEAVRRAFSVIESDPNMYMSEKANALLSIVDEVAHVDIALELKGEDRLSYQLMTKDNRDKKSVKSVTPSHEYQEAIAYASHTIMSKGTYNHMMEVATNSFDEAKRHRAKTHNAYQHVIAGTFNAQRLEELLYGDGVDKKSLAIMPISSIENSIGLSELEKYKKNIGLIKVTLLDGEDYYIYDSDMFSPTDRVTKTKMKKGESYEAIMRANNARLGINPGKNGSAKAFTALMANRAFTTEEAKQNNIINRNLPDNSGAITELFVSLAEKYASTQTKNILANMSNIKDKENYLLQYIDSKGNNRNPSSLLKRKDIVGGIFNAVKYLGEHGRANKGAMKVFEQYSGIKPTKEIADTIKEIAYLSSNNYRTMNEIKMISKLKAEHVASIVLDPLDLGDKLEKYKKRAEELGIKVQVLHNNMNVETSVSTAMNHKDTANKVVFQHGKEDDRSTLEKATEVLSKGADKILGKEDNNIIFEARDDKQGNISGYNIKKWFRSPSRLIEKYIPQMKPIIQWATESAVKSDKLQRKYIKQLDRIKTKLGEENIASFKKLTTEITDLGREFVQPAGVMIRNREVYINIKKDDIFREFKDEIDAKNLYNELAKEGKHVFMDYKDGNYRVFASNKPIKPYATWEQAYKASLPERDKAIRNAGYNENVLGAYNELRRLLDKVFDDKVKAWVASGADPDHKPKRLWGYVPMLHSRYGVYLARDVVDDKGNVYEKREKIASFHSYRDAEKHAKKQHVNDKVRIIITERNPKYDERLSFDIYEGANDSAYDDIVYEGESREQQEKRFERISHAYPEIKKIVDEFIGKKDSVTREKLMELINDKEKQKDLNLDPKRLQEELKHANLDELFRRRSVITRQDLIGHLLLGYGNLRKDKYNNTRTNAKGANPDVFDNLENYLRYSAHFIPANEFYHKATALYRSVIGTDYASQFGIGGEGARRDVEDLLHNYISSVIGIPNNADKVVNRTINELVGDGWIKKTYGETFATDLMNRSMEAVTIAKLGLFRPTAAIAQLGALLNIATKTGYTKELADAMRDATMFGPNSKNVSMAERRMFNNIGLNLEDTAMETQSLKNRKSLYNLTIGKVKLGKLFEKSMDMFNRTDKYTRRVAALHAFRKALAEGKTQQEAEIIASDFVRQTNFDYSDKDASRLFTQYGTLGKLILQFKKYSVKEMEFMYDIVKSGNKREMARFLGGYMVMAGLMGIPGISATDPFAEWISGKSNTARLKECIMEWAGGDSTKKQLALLAMYGLPAPTIGADFSRNIGVGDLIPTDNFAGPTLGTLGNLMTSFKNHNTANNALLSMAHDLSPAFANYYQATTGYKRDWTKGVDTRQYSDKERVLKFLGFRPILDSVNSDMNSINYANSQKEKEDKKALIYQYINDPKSVSVDELKAMNITKKNIADAKKGLNMTASDKMKTYGTKASKEKNKNKANKFAEFEEELD